MKKIGLLLALFAGFVSIASVGCLDQTAKEEDKVEIQKCKKKEEVETRDGTDEEGVVIFSLRHQSV